MRGAPARGGATPAPAPGSAEAALEATRAGARAALLDARVAAGHWEGELSSSALATATAVTALALVAGARPASARELDALVARGLAWLAAHPNVDGGYGDTVDSPTNLSTTCLVWAAFAAAGRGDAPAARGAVAWIETELGSLEFGVLAAGLEDVYGEDRTFAVPILVACAAAGCFGAPWPAIPPLPFELAVLPRGLFRFLGLPVVSYALPALIAIGQALHARRPSRNPLARRLRDLARGRTLATLARIQPEGGGFLEATPLTSFVLLSLVTAGRADVRVVDEGLAFLAASVRPDGAWPIDTNLATWVTTLAVGALAGGGALCEVTTSAERARLRAFLLRQQFVETHVYTGAAPGGWAWTDLPGGVPDADDTAGALLALRALRDEAGDDLAAVDGSAQRGLDWLMRLSNRDGGTPTFCRGWGKLPFDRSAPDLSAHALRAYAAWADVLEGVAGKGWADRQDRLHRLERASRAARSYLADTQRADGAWVPLWFGSQAEPRFESPLYGTARVLQAAVLAPAGRVWAAADGTWGPALLRGLRWLLAAQGADGGFGGAAGLPAGVEETALGLEALAAAAEGGLVPVHELALAMDRAALWLAEHTVSGTRFPAAPIGLYFARLWYAERLYPVVFTVAALERAAAVRRAP